MRAVLDRLKDYHGEGSDFDLADALLDELYEDMIKDGLSYVGKNRFERSVTEYTFEGERVTKFEDLVELESEKRKDEISELLQQIEEQ